MLTFWALFATLYLKLYTSETPAEVLFIENGQFSQTVTASCASHYQSSNSESSLPRVNLGTSHYPNCTFPRNYRVL